LRPINSRETEVILERQAFVADKKSNHFDMMIDMQKKNIKLTEKNFTRTIDHFKHKKKQTIMFACNLFGVDRQVYYQKNQKKTKEAKSN
jgi:hypothetical protein